MPTKELKEIKAKRTPHGSHFELGLNAKGVMEYLYEPHIGHVHYFNKLGVGDGETGWRKIDWSLSFDEVKRGWSFAFHSFIPFLPEYADGVVEFRDLFDGKDQTIKYTAQCSHVKGELLTKDQLSGEGLLPLTQQNCVIYRDAFGEGKDYILYFTRSTLCKAVRIRENYKGSTDQTFDFQVDFPKKGNRFLKVRRAKDMGNLEGAYDLDLSTKKTFDSDKQTLIGNDQEDGKEWHTYMRSFSAWDSGKQTERKSEKINVEFYQKAGKKYLTKVITGAFLASSKGDVFTDITTSYYSGSGDGYIYSLSTTSWANARQSSGGNANFSAHVGENVINIRNDYFSSAPYYYIMRGFTPFDTSGLGAGAVISAASLVVKDDGSTVTHTTHVVQTGQTSLTSLTTTMFPPPDYTSAASISAGSWSIGGTNTFTLDATGRGWINKTGNTYIGIMGDPDQSNAQPAGYNGGANPLIASSETANDPYLSITYTLPSGLHALERSPIRGVMRGAMRP